MIYSILFQKVHTFPFLRRLNRSFSFECFPIHQTKKESSVFERLLSLVNISVDQCFTKENYENCQKLLIEKYEELKFALSRQKEKNAYDEFVYDCIKRNKVTDLFIVDVVYENGKNILCLGEGNLSFSVLLQKKLPSAKIVATSLEDQSTLVKCYGSIFSKNKKIFEKNGGIYVPQINAQFMDKQFPAKTFDMVIFNFPFVIPSKEFIENKWDLHLENKSDDTYVKYYKKSEYFLMNRLFLYLLKNASFILKEYGLLYIRINDKYDTCKFPTDSGLSFLRRIHFGNVYEIHKSLKYIPSIFNYDVNSNMNNTKKKNFFFTKSGKIIYKSYKMEHTSTLIFQKRSFSIHIKDI